jgi:hypothetical protein
MKKENKPKLSVVESIITSILHQTGRFAIGEVRNSLKRQGYSFGSPEELIDFAERQKTRMLIGRIVDEQGKRKYHSTTQPSLFGTGRENIYLPTEMMVRKPVQEEQNLRWLRRHLVALIKRTPLLPNWAIEEIVRAINHVFDRMKNAA